MEGFKLILLNDTYMVIAAKKNVEIKDIDSIMKMLMQ
jgi:hypothetical protein